MNTHVFQCQLARVLRCFLFILARHLTLYKKEIMNAIEYAKNVSELLAVPYTALRVRRLIDDDRSDANSISAVVQTDPGLAAHILKVANSAIFRFPRKIDKLTRAIQVIGTSAVYDYALIFSLSNAFSSEQRQFVDLDKFWEQSVSCAILARHFGLLKGNKNADRLFVNGLLHNIGELVVLKLTPDLAKDCARFDTELSPKECQYDVLGFSYAEVSAALGQQWMLPDPIVSTIAMQHHNNAAAESLEVGIMQLAYELSIINTFSHHYSFETHLPSYLYESLKFNNDDIEEALDNTNYQVEQIIHLFNPDSFQIA
jgi:HD-like signal output (HDOD) protein